MARECPTCHLPIPRKIATIPVGYVDGITKIGSGKTEALVRGKRVPPLQDRTGQTSQL